MDKKKTSWVLNWAGGQEEAGGGFTMNRRKHFHQMEANREQRGGVNRPGKNNCYGGRGIWGGTRPGDNLRGIECAERGEE